MKFVIVTLGALVLAAPAWGATAEVSISGSAFNPQMTTIDQGDSVRWTNNDILQHTVTFSGFGSPGNLGNGDTVRLSNPTNALIVDDRGLGTIVNDD